MQYTPAHMMVIAAARQLSNDDICLVGIGTPSAACNLARLTHAPDIMLIYESGTIDTRPATLPLSIGDGELCATALTTVDLPEMFSMWLQAGRINIGFLGAAQIDRHANLNSTVIGPYDKPTIRLPGAGGAPEIATGCQETLVVLPMTKRHFVSKLDFRTTLGHGDGPGDRQRHGVTTRGPRVVITDLCLLKPDPVTCQLVVTSLHQGVTKQQVQDNCQWDIQFADQLEQTPPPTELELTTLLDLYKRTEQAHQATASLS